MNFKRFTEEHFILRFLQAICFLVFFSRGWIHLFGDPPYRALFWDEGLMKGLVEGLTSMSWQEYATSIKVNHFIQGFTHVIGVIYLLAGIAVLRLNKERKWMGRMLILGISCLVFLSFIFYKSKFYNLGQFFEYATQWGTPIILYFWIYKPQIKSKLIIWGKVAIALTFICHGLYAIGYYPRPGNYVDMTIRIMGFSEPFTHEFLKVAGILDMIVAIGIFLPYRWAKYFLWYMVVWGMLTALARFVANYYPNELETLFIWWLPETLVRFPHGLFPLWLILVLWSQKLGQTKEI